MFPLMPPEILSDGAAETMRALGYDAIDLTLRPGGHVLPERVAEDLPKAAEL